MKGLRIFKLLVFLLSACMFIVQFKTAVNKLKNPTVTESTKYLDIGDIEPPLITICPNQQYNTSISFYTAIELLNGSLLSKDQGISWGGRWNVSFEQLVKVVMNYKLRNIAIKDGDYKMYKTKERIMPYYGICYDIQLSSLQEEAIFTIIPMLKNDFEVFITDNNLQRFGGVYHPSHLESRITVGMYQYKEFEVVIEIKSYFDPTHPEQCSAYKDDEYFECVDEEAQKVFYPKLGCNPPWISPNNQCTGILYGEDKRKFINEKLFNTKVNGVWISENKIHQHMKNHKLAPYETNCKRPCNVTTSYVKLKDDRADTTRLKLTFTCT